MARSFPRLERGFLHQVYRKRWVYGGFLHMYQAMRHAVEEKIYKSEEQSSER